jgi:hypothetical protein
MNTLTIVFLENSGTSSEKAHIEKRNLQVENNLKRVVSDEPTDSVIRVTGKDFKQLNAYLTKNAESIKNSKGADKKNGKITKVRIMGHGTPSLVGGCNSDTLAKGLIDFIEKTKGINQIEICACNTGQEVNGQPSFLDKFCMSLSRQLSPESVASIKVTAPRGIVVFYQDGETEVIRDDKPLALTHDFIDKIYAIDMEKEDKCTIKKKLLSDSDLCFPPHEHKFAEGIVIPFTKLIAATKSLDFTVSDEFKMSRNIHSFFSIGTTLDLTQEAYDMLVKYYSEEIEADSYDSHVEEITTKLGGQTLDKETLKDTTENVKRDCLPQLTSRFS